MTKETNKKEKIRDRRFKHSEEVEGQIYLDATSGMYTAKYIREKYGCSYDDITNIKRRKGYYDKCKI